MYSDYPFYSPNRGIGVVDVYHSHPACQVAQSIAPEFRFGGNPHHWPECACCALHQAPRVRLGPVGLLPPQRGDHLVDRELAEHKARA